MEVKKFSELDQKKKCIVLAVAILVLILLLLLLLRSCGCDNGGNNDDGTATTTTSSPADDDGDSDDPSTTPTFDPADIGYDENLISTWYKDDMAMVLSENGYGSLYYGDADGGEIQWYTVDNYLSLTTAEKTSVVTYVINGSDLVLTYSNGQVETWFN